MNNLIDKIALSKLTQDEAKNLMDVLINDELSRDEIVEVLLSFNKRFICKDEVIGFRKSLLNLAVKPKIEFSNLLDVCGTGGDLKNTFNISTLTALVVAGTGQKVAKHGNYSFSSSCGSSNILESCGVKFSNDADYINKSLEKANIVFLHAPLFHPALKNLAPIRKELQCRTIFNLLGPLLNPLQPQAQYTGVSSSEIFSLYYEVLDILNIDYSVVYTLDGYDEISLTDNFKLANKKEVKVYSPQELGFNLINQTDISGGNDIAASKKIFLDILDGKGTTNQNNVVLINSSFALMTAQDLSFAEAYDLSKASLESKKALQSLMNVTK